MADELIEPMTHTEDTFTTATGETIVVRHYAYKYPDITHHLYDLILKTPRGYNSIFRSTETEIPEDKK